MVIWVRSRLLLATAVKVPGTSEVPGTWSDMIYKRNGPGLGITGEGRKIILD